jgi:MtN3 and saliva related transmembrane protein
MVPWEIFMCRLAYTLIVSSLFSLLGCDDLVPRDTRSLLIPDFQRSEVLGLVAGFGTTFAAMPDLIAMLKRRSSAGMNPRMVVIMGIFQVLWVYYGVLIGSRPVIVWNVIAVLINSLTVGAYFRFARKEKGQARGTMDHRSSNAA